MKKILLSFLLAFATCFVPTTVHAQNPYLGPCVGGGTACVQARGILQPSFGGTGTNTGTGWAFANGPTSPFTYFASLPAVPSVNSSADPVVLSTGANCSITTGIQTCTFPGSGGQSTPALLPSGGCQNSTNNPSGGTTILTLTCSSVVAGNTILLQSFSSIGLGGFNSVTFSATDSQGNTYNLIDQRSGYVFAFSTAIFYATIRTSGADTITITMNSSPGGVSLMAATADQFAGVNSINPVVQHALYEVPNATHSVGFNFTPTQSNDLMYFAPYVESTASAVFSATGYTAITPRYFTQGGTSASTGTMYALTSSANVSLWAPTFNWTNGGYSMGWFVEFAASGQANPVVSSYPAAGVVVATGNPASPWGTSLSANGFAYVGTPTANQAACIKSAGPPVVIGYCSTVVGSGGGCTCN